MRIHHHHCFALERTFSGKSFRLSCKAFLVSKLHTSSSDRIPWAGYEICAVAVLEFFFPVLRLDPVQQMFFFQSFWGCLFGSV
jgi:hypothetical protein